MCPAMSTHKYKAVVLPLGQEHEVAALPFDGQDEHGVMVGSALKKGLLIEQMQVFLFLDHVGSIGDPGLVIVKPDIVDDVRGLLLNQAHLHNFTQLPGAGVSKRHAEFTDHEKTPHILFFSSWLVDKIYNFNI